MGFLEGHGGAGLIAATFLVCVVSGLVPVVNAELYLLSMAALTDSRALLPALALAAALGQMVAKMVLYAAGRGLLSLPAGRWQRKLEAARAKARAWGRAPYGVVFASAFVGLPPFYVVSVAAGGFAMSPAAFAVIGLVGRTLRFGTLLLLGSLL